MIVAGDGAVVHADAAEFEALLDAGALHLRPVFEEKRQERGGFGDGALGRHGLSCHGKKLLAKEKRGGTFSADSQRAS